MKTKNGVELNLKESNYCFEFNHAVFYFSSKFNLCRFKNSVETFIEMEHAKIINRYKVNINLKLYLAISLYKKIEKRGFRIVQKFSDKSQIELTENTIFSI